MNETTSSPIIIALLFVLRCLIPLGILFGVSYLFRRLELVIDRSDDEFDDVVNLPPVAPAAPELKIKDTPQKIQSPKKKTSGGKKRSATSKKKKEQ